MLVKYAVRIRGKLRLKLPSAGSTGQTKQRDLLLFTGFAGDYNFGDGLQFKELHARHARTLAQLELSYYYRVRLARSRYGNPVVVQVSFVFVASRRGKKGL